MKSEGHVAHSEHSLACLRRDLDGGRMAAGGRGHGADDRRPALVVRGVAACPVCPPAVRLHCAAASRVREITVRRRISRTVGNLIWLVFAGWWLGLAHRHGCCSGDHGHRPALRLGPPQAGRLGPVAIGRVIVSADEAERARNWNRWSYNPADRTRRTA